MLIKNISVLDVIGGKILEHQDIYIEGKLIKKIGENLKIEDDQIIDGENKLAVPGFVNAHTHLGMSLFRNYADDMELMEWLGEKIWPIEAKLNPEDVYIGSLMSMAEMIKSGATTFCDMYFPIEPVYRAMEEIGIRGAITRGMMDVEDGSISIREHKEGYKKYNGALDGRVTLFPGPHAIYTSSTEYLKEVIEVAKEYGGRINIHLSETETEVRDSLEKYNMTPIEYVNSLGLFELPTVAAHCVHITDEEIEIVKGKEFYPVYNPSSNLKLASGFTPVKKLLANGLKVCLGTDGSSSNNNQNMLEEIHIASIVNKAVEMDPKAVKAIEVLRMATINGAEALNINAGAIEEGRLADISIFDLNSLNFTPKNNLISALCYSASSEDIKTVIIDGKIVLDDRKFVNIDEDKLIKDVNETMNDLISR
ncbi:amidohydrolase [uncultured Peptoniphilus sp.]|uniref:amidohydrolase n=1 Tax=uncultured Peptoniphilus sp. TaxID=254354 RepID=UPI002805608F|nr:amidohydrolase [uncultured Peptoniphilus sp.]